MIKHQSILIYLLIFLAFSILLSLFGVIDFSLTEISGYILIFFGIGIVYLSFGRNRKISLFIGTFSFLTGLVLYIISHFDFLRASVLLIPSVLLIFGISILFVAVDNPFSITSFIISLILISLGIYYSSNSGTLTFSDFSGSLLDLLIVYWPVFIIFGGIFLLLRKERNE